jgi:hypothetical protein
MSKAAVLNRFLSVDVAHCESDTWNYFDVHVSTGKGASGTLKRVLLVGFAAL